MSTSPPLRLLLVEGQDDKHVVLHIQRRLKKVKAALPSFGIADKDGITELVKSIPVEIKVADREALGILVDANDDRIARWQSITDRLRQEGIRPPHDIDPNGTVFDHQELGLRLGVWLMPDNDSAGEIEDFAAKLIPESDPVWPLARQYIECIPDTHRPSKTTKAEINAWLAGRETPRRMGEAISKGDLSLEGSSAELFASWLRRLFA